MSYRSTRRQSLVTLLVVGLSLLVPRAWGEAPTAPYRIAVLTAGLTFMPVLEGLREGLVQLGYHEGKQITFIIENSKGRVADFPAQAAHLVAEQPDVLFTIGTATTTAAMRATTTIPIVFAWVGDPLRSGLIASFATSKNNLTGVSVYSGPLSGKRLEILTDIAPQIRRVLAIVAVQDSIATSSFAELEETANKLGIALRRRDVTSKAEIEQVLQETPPGSVDAIYHVPSVLVGVHIDLLIQKAKVDKIPLMVHEDSIVQEGALASYGANFRLLGVQAAKVVAKILQGAKPAEIPTQTPDALLLTVNLSTAKAIGLPIPPQVLERADRLLE